MTENPYQSPRAVGQAIVAESSLRKQARRSFRISALILFFPAVYNYWAFDTLVMARHPEDLANLYRTTNIVGLVIVGALTLFLGVPCLEAVARFLHHVFADGDDRTVWENVLYRSLIRATYLAIPGAALWVIWVFGFYQMDSDFYAISWAVGVPAHLLAACWYVPLIQGWYRLVASRSVPSRPQN